MSKPASYREIPYSITKGPSLKSYWSTRPAWHGVISFPKGEERVERETRHQTVEAIEQIINIHLDYGGDHELYRIVEELVANLTRHDAPFVRVARGEEPRKIPPTIGKLRKRLHRACEIAERVLFARYAGSDRAALIEKLRAMTVERGCTPAEAAAALMKLEQLEASS
jgi:hypothetical protein